MSGKFFRLRVKKGSKIISAAGDYTVSEIPENALELLEAGCSWLIFSNDAVTPLSKLTEQRLIKMKALRQAQGFASDVEILDAALSLKLHKSKQGAQSPKRN